MKERLDVLVYSRGLAASREKARAMIMAGEVFVDGQREDKPGGTFAEDAAIEVRGKSLKYVSRGGLKLEKAVDVFGIKLEGLSCMDVGASTGGFTDCMLQNGASGVAAVDVGYGQLDWKLRNDPKVKCLEKTNARYITPEVIGGLVDFVSIDVSFISLTKILGAVCGCMKDRASLVCLIKPQFEAGREKVGKKGVVRDRATHREVIDKIIAFAPEAGFKVLGLTYSPVKGPEGNIEYLLYLTKDPDAAEAECSSEKVVDEAHAALDV